MAKSDSSAVQKLIELAQQKPLELDADLDGLFAEDARARNARHALPPPRRGAASMSPSSSLPPLPRTRAPVSTNTGFAPVATPPRPQPRLGAVALPEPTSPLALDDLALRDDDVPRTQQTARPRSSVAPWIIAGAFALGVGFAGVYLVAEGLEPAAARPDRAIAAAMPAAVAAAAAPAPVAPAAALTVEPAPAPAVAPGPAASITVSFLSRPAGASVILVENGSMTPLGRTPLTAPLPAGTNHEVLFTLEGRATVLAHVNPAKQTEVSVELGGAEPVVTPAPAPEPPVRIVREEPSESRPKRAREQRAEKSEKPAEKRVAAAGRGVLMLGAKPPCDIIIDGKSTGLTTPQREIPLPAGKRIITLVNKQHGIKKSFAVMVTSGETVKVVKDLTEMMK